MNTPVVSIHNVSFRYDSIPILDDVHLDIFKHDSLCVVGPNGGGKSTLIKLIMGLLKPDSGTLTVFGQQPERARLKVGYVPQYAKYDPQFPVSVLDVVKMGRLGCSPSLHFTDRDKQLALEALAEMDLAPLAQRRFSAISGGQRQRVLIARALASQSDLLILDEPTANIDNKSEEHLFEILTQLNTKMTIILVTHDIGFASKFFNRIACVNRQVVTHPTSELTGELIRNMYGGDQMMIRHDHHCSHREA